MDVRVVMELSFNTTTDSTEVGMPLACNTEDEIFYSLSGARVVDGKHHRPPGQHVGALRSGAAGRSDGCFAHQGFRGVGIRGARREGVP
jgi:hypothetical protein